MIDVGLMCTICYPCAMYTMKLEESSQHHSVCVCFLNSRLSVWCFQQTPPQRIICYKSDFLPNLHEQFCTLADIWLDMLKLSISCYRFSSILYYMHIYIYVWNFWVLCSHVYLSFYKANCTYSWIFKCSLFVFSGVIYTHLHARAQSIYNCVSRLPIGTHV